MPKIAALGAVAVLLCTVLVRLPVAGASPLLINDSFAYSTTDSQVVGASSAGPHGNGTGNSGQPLPCLTAAVINQSSPTSITVTTAAADGDDPSFSRQIDTVGNDGAVTFSAASSTPSGFSVSTSGAVSATGSPGPNTYEMSGTDYDGSSPEYPNDTGIWALTIIVVASDAPIEQSAPTANTTTTTNSGSFTDNLATTDASSVTFSAASSTPAGVNVSTSGGVSITGSLPIGTYDLSGTDTDGSNTGTWSYTLYVTSAATQLPNCDLATPDQDGSGSLALTDAGFHPGSLMLTDTGFGEAADVIYSGEFSTSDGLDLTFDTHMFGGQDVDRSIGIADGISFDLALPGLTSVGQTGGALGYSTDQTSPGMPGGYLGVGLDEYGNYSTDGYGGDSDSCTQFGYGRSPNEVTVRGPGYDTTGYCLLSSSLQDTPTDPMGASGIQLHGDDWTDSTITMHIVIDPKTDADPMYLVSLQPIGASTPTTVTSGLLPTTYYDTSGDTVSGHIPPELTFAIAGSTGSGTDFHEIDNLSVNQATLTSITVTPTDPTTNMGGTQQFTATGNYSDGTTEDLTSQVTWSSGTPTVATIDSGGLATGVFTGTSVITATDGSVSGDTTLTVVPNLTSIAVTPPDPSTSIGGTQQFTATGTYSDGTTEDLTSQVTWTSGTPSVATIDLGGLATGVMTGTSLITATDGSVSGDTTLTVDSIFVPPPSGSSPTSPPKPAPPQPAPPQPAPPAPSPPAPTPPLGPAPTPTPATPRPPSTAPVVLVPFVTQSPTVTPVPTPVVAQVAAPRSLVLTRATVIPGESTVAEGVGCAPGAPVVLAIGGTTVATTTADSSGAFSASITPPTQEAGRVTVTATCGSTQLATLLALVSTSTVSTPEGGAAVFSVFVLLGAVLLRGQFTSNVTHRRAKHRRRRRSIADILGN